MLTSTLLEALSTRCISSRTIIPKACLGAQPLCICNEPRRVPLHISTGRARGPPANSNNKTFLLTFVIFIPNTFWTDKIAIFSAPVFRPISSLSPSDL